MLPVRNLSTSVAFYRKLGFDVVRQMDDWGWAHLRNGDCQIMLDQSINPHAAASRASVLYLYPADIEEYHRQARANGLTVPELEVTFYGMTEFRFEDPDGNRLWVGQDRSTGKA